MSSDSPQPYSGNAYQPPGAYGPPQGAYQPQPYVEQGVPQQPGGGQPPYVPPGAYTPVPVPPSGAGRGRGPKIAVAAILSVVLLAAIGAVVLFKFVLKGGPDPAESFPASASMYMEINLDPSFDQTPKLLEHLSKFEDLDYADTDDMTADLLEESGLEGVDAEDDVASWLGNRHGMAMWSHDDQQYAVISLASTDANAAEDGLAQLRAAAGIGADQLAYAVEDDHVLLVAGESGAAEALAAAESEAGSEPLAASDAYDEARSWLDGDQLVTYWVDMDAIVDLAELTGGTDTAMLSELYSGQMIAGLSAFDDGFELNYRLFGDQDDPWTGSSDLVSAMADMPAGDLAMAAYIPEDIGDLVADWLGIAEEYFYGGGSATSTEPAMPLGEPLTDAEYAEYLELEDQYLAGTLDAAGEERYFELESRYWMYGTEDEPVDYGQDGDIVYGPDFEEIESTVNQFTDLLAGANLSGAMTFSADDEFSEESVYLAVELADDRAAELQELLETTAGEELPEGYEVTDNGISFTGSEVAAESLADDARFQSFADVAPSETALALWVDLEAAAAAYPDDFEGAEPLSAVAWAHGSDGGDGTGVIRLYLKD
ncbi:hypothetical protein [Glycomyces rhizosphaerae]|uniref:DUF3352 domain-containing protein n=1 Tax=Glycomyces rhizosphaerae TaxID=2054422 RepID=A0ABV7Q7X5_9ACTN